MTSGLEDGMNWDLLPSLVRLQDDLKTKSAKWCGFLTVCWPRSWQTSYLVAQGSSASVPDPRSEAASSFITELHELHRPSLWVEESQATQSKREGAQSPLFDGRRVKELGGYETSRDQELGKVSDLELEPGSFESKPPVILSLIQMAN